MTGSMHYQVAEVGLRRAAQLAEPCEPGSPDFGDNVAVIACTLGAALVHAVLALTAATVEINALPGRVERLQHWIWVIEK